MSGDRQRRTHRHLQTSRPAMIESLEERRLMTLTVAVTQGGAPGDGGTSSIQVTSVGQVVNLQVWAEVTDPQNVPSTDGLQDVDGSFLSTGVGTGPVDGDLTATVLSPFAANGSQSGTPQDLNSDGNVDVGSNDDSTVDNFFFARSGGMETANSGTIVGNSLDFEIGTLTYTVTNLDFGGETDINYRSRDALSVNEADAVWREDGLGISDFTGGGVIADGAPFVITAPGSTPSPTAVNDSDSTVLNTPVFVPVLSNDVDAFAAIDTSSVKVVTAPTHGTAVAESNGTVDYIPNAGFIGSDSFTYTVNDVNGKTSNAAKVTMSTGLGLSSAKGGVKSVTYTDADGTLATMSLNIGQATLSFAGGGSVTTKGGKATLAGTSAINGITLSGTTAASVLSIKGKGGDGTVDVSSITDSAPMGKIAAPILVLTGTSNFASLTALQAANLNGANITIGSGSSKPVTITAPTLTGASITAAGNAVSLIAGSVANSTVNALSDNAIRVSGTVSDSTLSFTSTAVAGQVALTGDVDNSLFTSAGAFKNVSAGSLTQTTISSGPIASLHVKGGVESSSIQLSNATAGPIRITIGGAMDNSIINSAATLTSVSAGSLTGSAILAGTTDDTVTLGTVTASTLGTGTIQNVHIAKTFSNSNIIAQTIDSASLGTVDTTASTTPQGVAAKTYKSATLSVNGTALHLGNKQLALITALQDYLTQKDVQFTPVETVDFDGVAFATGATADVVTLGLVVGG